MEKKTVFLIYFGNYNTASAMNKRYPLPTLKNLRKKNWGFFIYNLYDKGLWLVNNTQYKW